MKRFALLLAAGTAFVSPALAADVVYEEPPVPMAEAAPLGWTGFYVGIQGGAAFNPSQPDYVGVSTNFGLPVTVPGATANDEFSNNYHSKSDASFAGGAHAGYDYQINQFVVGAVIDINAMDYSETTGVVSRTADAFYDQQRSLDYLATARVRAGYLVTPTALAYATGGLAYGEVDYEFNTNNAGILAGTIPTSVNEDEDDFGYTVGGGMEVKVTDNVSFGAEYLYTNLGGSSETVVSGGVFAGAAGTGATTFSSDEDFDFHTVTAKMSYRFN